MVGRALEKLSDGLKQALEEALATQRGQLEQFIQSQTQELKEAVVKGTHEVVVKLDMIHKEISKSQQSQDVSYKPNSSDQFSYYFL